MLILVLFLVSLTIQVNITINDMEDKSRCDFNIIRFTTFNLSATSHEEINFKENEIFFISIKGKSTSYDSLCYFPANKKNSTDPSDTVIINTNSDENKTTSTNSTSVTSTIIRTNLNASISSSSITSTIINNNTIRRLDSEENVVEKQNSTITNLNGSCFIFSDIQNNEEVPIKKKTVSIISSENVNITFENNFKNITFMQCGAKLSEYETDLNISYRQINNFRYLKDEKEVAFDFYGYTFNNISEKEYIIMNVNLVINGFKKEKTDTAICYPKNEVITNGDKRELVEFDCAVKYISENATSLVFHSSKYISGIPKDEALLRPVSTSSNGGAPPMSLVSNSEDAPTLKITRILPSNCGENGIFDLYGNLNNPKKEDLEFTLQFSNPEKVTANCFIEESNKTVDILILCKTNGDFYVSSVKIPQQSIYDDKQIEQLMIEKYESNTFMNCADGILHEITNTGSEVENKKSPIIFRQINNYEYKNNKISLFFAGLTNRNITKGENISINFTSYPRDSSQPTYEDFECTVNSDVNTNNGEYVQVDCDCVSINNIENEPSRIEIHSSPNITGMIGLKDFDKNPNLADEIIKKTKYNHNIGKLKDHYLSKHKKNNLPTLTIENVRTHYCQSDGTIELIGTFDKDIEDEFDFRMNLSYPISWIKCTAPKIQKNIRVYIDCKVLKAFDNMKTFRTEANIVKIKYKEVLLVKKTNLTESTYSCGNYTKIQEDKIYTYLNADYAFLQANSLEIVDDKLKFNLIVYPVREIKEEELPNEFRLKIQIRKNISNLRNLEEQEDIENDIACNQDSRPSNNFLPYKCEVGYLEEGLKIKNKSEIESLKIKEWDPPLTGIRDDNNNLLKIDENIKNGTIGNYSNKDNNLTYLTLSSLDTSSCQEKGDFYFNGEIHGDTDVTKYNLDNGEIELKYLRPSDSDAVCIYNKTKDKNEVKFTCHNRFEFSNQNLIIPNQFINDVLINKTEFNKTFSCAISDDAERFPDDNDDEDYEGGVNNFFKRQKSGGLSGGAIAAIAISCAVAIVGVVALIILLNGKSSPLALNAANVNANANTNANTNTSGNVPQLSSSLTKIA